MKAGTGLAVLMVTVFFPLTACFLHTVLSHKTWCLQFTCCSPQCAVLFFPDFYNYIVVKCCNAHSVIALNGLSLAFASCSVLSAQLFLCSQHCFTSGLVMALVSLWYQVMDLVVRSSISSPFTVYSLCCASACRQRKRYTGKPWVLFLISVTCNNFHCKHSTVNYQGCTAKAQTR